MANTQRKTLCRLMDGMRSEAAHGGTWRETPTVGHEGEAPRGGHEEEAWREWHKGVDIRGGGEGQPTK